ncbi:MAG TPA: M48 family metalloprotease [Bryobacteraceae bacterium]|nr:M48 family metalloprotease [Bryobacteraceae bacterium]
MQRIAIALTLIVAGGLSAPAQNTPSFDDVVDRAIVQENNLLKILRGDHPLAETYIQDLGPDTDFGTAPKTDHYFLGKLDFSHGVTTDSYIPNAKGRGIDAFAHLFAPAYLPRGFAQTLIIDGAEFNRDHYDFRFDRREFLGDVRTYVISVSPKKTAGRGRFIGKIWVEDKEFNIVRFNGTYSQAGFGQAYTHFDSWRVNCGPDLWMPFETYAEESDLASDFHTQKLHFKAVTRVWGYTTAENRSDTEFTNITVDLPGVQDKSDQAADNSPVESQRAWERQSEDNVLDRLEAGNILAPRGPVEKILDTVVNNLVVTNDLHITPEVRTRVILTTPLETFTIGHTIVISRGLLDTLPDEASLAAIMAHELGHIALGQVIDTKFAFSDRTIFDDDAILRKFRFTRTTREEDSANAKAIEILQKSPYADKLQQPGLFLKALGTEAERLPNLITPLIGGRLAQGNSILRLSALLQDAPQLQRTRTDQIAALPLGARTSLDPWTNRLRMVTVRAVPLLSGREKMPFEISPVYLHLRYESADGEQLAQDETAHDGARP